MKTELEEKHYINLSQDGITDKNLTTGGEEQVQSFIANEEKDVLYQSQRSEVQDVTTNIQPPLDTAKHYVTSGKDPDKIYVDDLRKQLYGDKIYYTGQSTDKIYYTGQSSENIYVNDPSRYSFVSEKESSYVDNLITRADDALNGQAEMDGEPLDDAEEALDPAKKDGLLKKGAKRKIKKALKEELENLDDNVAWEAAVKYTEGGVWIGNRTVKPLSKKGHEIALEAGRKTGTAVGSAVSSAKKNVASAAQAKVIQLKNQLKTYRDLKTAGKGASQAFTLGKGAIGILSKAFSFVFGGGGGAAIAVIAGIIFLSLSMQNAFMGVFQTTMSFTAEESSLQETRDYVTTKDTAVLDKYAAIGSEPEYSHIDEVRRSMNGTVKTDQLKLLCFLSVKYQDFNFAEVQAPIDTLHSDLYQFEITETVETETRTTTTTVTDPITGETTEVEEEEEYDIYILNVDLNCKEIDTYIQANMTADEKEWFNVLLEMQTILQE